MVYTAVIRFIGIVLDLAATRKLILSTRMLLQTTRLHIALVWLILHPFGGCDPFEFGQTSEKNEETRT